MAGQDVRQGEVDASVYARAIESLGKDVSEGVRNAMLMRLKLKELDLQSLTKIKDFMSLPADKRKALLQDPSFRQNIIQTLDPEAFRSKRKAGKMAPDEMQQRISSAMQLGEETPEEKSTREEKASQAKKVTAEAGIKTAEQQLSEQKARISLGKEQGTPISLALAGDIKDPIAGALLSLIPPNELKIIAEGEKKTGPLFQQQQMQEWYKWGVNEGLPMGIAMQTAMHIARGEWDKVPLSYQDASTGKTTPIRGKAEQQLAFEALNTRAHVQEVNNNIQNSIAQGAAQLAEKAGIPLDQARANIIALRDGKPTPFPTKNLEDMVTLSKQQKQQEIEKNTQSILKDKTDVIREALNTMLAEYKDTSTIGGFASGAQQRDLEDKINGLQEALAKSLAAGYGVKFDTYDANHPWSAAVRGAIGATWQGAKATGTFGLDLTTEAGKAIANEFDKMSAGDKANVSLVAPEVAVSMQPASTAKFTKDQENIMMNMIDSFNAALSSDQVPAEQKQAIRKYIEGTLKPIYEDPSRFLELFKQPDIKPEPQQEF